MLSKLRSRLTYANTVASIALFIALGGTSYGLATGSIGSREIKDNTVRSKDLRNNDVRGKDIRNGTIGSRKVKDGALLAEDFMAGQLPAGPPGEDGAPGKDGAPGATNVVVRTVEPCPALPSGVHCSMPIQCQAGERATGGGAGFSDFGGNEVVDVSQPLEADNTLPEAGDVPTGWFSAIEYSGGGPRNAIGYVVCASP